jgi:long-chain acyl-CoA synthetase
MIMTPTGALYRHIETGRKKVAFIRDDEEWTYKRLATEVERVARGLIAHGLRKGDRVALHMANLPEFVIAYHACFRIGVIAAPLNIRFKTAELRPLLERLRPSLYIGQAALYERIASIAISILGADRRFVVDGPVNDPRVQPWTNLFAGVNGEPIERTVDVDAPAVLLTTSGTTGQPKFVTHTLATLFKTAESIVHLDLDGDQNVALAAPIVHASGLFTMLARNRFGAPFVLLERFDPETLLDAIKVHRCTWVCGLPFMFVALLQRQLAHPRKVDSLRTCLAAGDVCAPQLQEQFSIFFGVPLRSFWASTEACGSLTYGLQPGPVSRIAPDREARLVDENAVPVPQGEVGELTVRGPNVTIGYWAGPGQIKDARKQGWFYTGDLMRQDNQGNLWFVSRKKHLIIRGGSNISPVEVECVLMAHPAVRDAAVAGVPDPELGQRVAGFVQLANGGSQDVILDEIRAQEIPRNALGKIDRNLLVTITSESSQRVMDLLPATPNALLQHFSESPQGSESLWPKVCQRQPRNLPSGCNLRQFC